MMMSSYVLRDDDYYYRHYLGAAPPSSLQHFRCFHASGFGNGNWILYFEIDPKDLPAVLAGGRYRPATDPLESDADLLVKHIARLRDTGIPVPAEPLEHCYLYLGPRPWPQKLYTNAAQTRVYVQGRY
jgi:hypothetical protein